MIYGKDFILYLECQTLTDDLMLPICVADNVGLDLHSNIREVAGPNDAQDSYFVYGRNTYSLNVSGFITYSLKEIRQRIIEVQEKLLEADNKLVSVGGVPVSSGGDYFCLENALIDWKVIKWMFEGATTPIKWSGSALVSDLSDTFASDGLAKFSGQLQVTGKIARFHTPAPSNVHKEYQTDTLPEENVTILTINPVQQGSVWSSGFTLSGTPLPNGKISTLGIDYTVQIGDTLPDLITGLAKGINAALPAGVLSSTAGDDTLMVEKDNNSSTNATYTNHTGTLRSVGIAFDSEINYDFYRVKVEQGGNTWYIDVQGTTPTLILPTGTYQISVSGMGADLQYSDYSETTTITIN